MHESEPAKRAAQMDEGKRFIDLASKMGAPYVRVFGDKYLEGGDRSATLERVSAGLHELGEYARGSRVTVIIESHGDFTDSPTLLKILKAAASDQVALLWDAHHTFVAGKEQPADTFKALGRYVRHVHLKDSKPDDKGEHHYVLTGTGTVPVNEQVRVLAAGGYQGFYCFEWEKVWHPKSSSPRLPSLTTPRSCASTWLPQGSPADKHAIGHRIRSGLLQARRRQHPNAQGLESKHRAG